MANTSIHISDELLERVRIDCEQTHRSISNWFTVAAEAALTRRLVRERTDEREASHDR